MAVQVCNAVKQVCTLILQACPPALQACIVTMRDCSKAVQVCSVTLPVCKTTKQACKMAKSVGGGNVKIADGRLGQGAFGRRGARVSPPAAASPDLTAWDFLDADWTVHALRLGGARVVPTRSAWQAVDAGNLGAFMPAFLLLTRADCNDRMPKIQS